MDESIRSRLEADLKTAMRARDTQSRDAIRYILAGVKNAAIEFRGDLPETEAIAAVRRIGKQMVDSITQYRDAGRDDLADHEQIQLDVLRRYLPAEMGDDELSALVAGVIAELGVSGPKGMGKLMPVLIARADGRAEGGRLSAAAKAALADGV